MSEYFTLKYTLKALNPYMTRILNLKYVFIDFAEPN